MMLPTQWPEYAGRLERRGWDYNAQHLRAFYAEVDGLLSNRAARVLGRCSVMMGGLTREDVAAASDADLLGVYDLGPALLAEIRQAIPATESPRYAAWVGEGGPGG
jgi:hypothetical protein